MLINIQPSELEGTIGLIKRFMNWAVSHLATRRALRGLVTNGRCLKEERWDKGAIRKGLWEGVSFGRKGVARVFIMQIHVASPFWYG